MMPITRRRRPSIPRPEPCDAQILVWPPYLDTGGIAGVATCTRTRGHVNLFHEGPLDSHGLTVHISWLETDRRNFRGPLTSCTYPRCSLPHPHPGAHVT